MNRPRIILTLWRERRAGRCKAPRRRRCGDIVEERQRCRCPRDAGTQRAHGGCTAIAALLVVNDVPASPPPRALRSRWAAARTQIVQAPCARPLLILGQAPSAKGERPHLRRRWITGYNQSDENPPADDCRLSLVHVRPPWCGSGCFDSSNSSGTIVGTGTYFRSCCRTEYFQPISHQFQSPFAGLSYSNHSGT